ncbi:MAG: hypothetical protein EOM08_07345 [Clostridia bacterium]|nr:hypothetical protein [Clostridia bacterium]
MSETRSTARPPAGRSGISEDVPITLFCACEICGGPVCGSPHSFFYRATFCNICG